MKLVRILAAGLAITFGTVTAFAPVNAAIVVDQQAIVPPNPSLDPLASRIFAAVGTLAPHTNAKFIQTITAGVSGILSGLDLQGPFFTGPVSEPFGYRLSLWDGDASTGMATLIGFQDAVIGSYQSDFMSQNATNFDFSSYNYAVSPGKLFSISVDPLFAFDTAGLVPIGNVLGFVNNDFRQPILSLNQYAGGVLYSSLDASPYSVVPADLGFRTYVNQIDHAAVPEPAGWMLMLIGFSIVGVTLRREKLAYINLAAR